MPLLRASTLLKLSELFERRRDTFNPLNFLFEGSAPHASLPTTAEMEELAQDIMDETGALIELDMLDDQIHLGYVEGSRGSGWEAIRQLCDYADAHELDIVLTVLHGAPGLVRYYLRHGFDLDGIVDINEMLEWLSEYEKTYDPDSFEDEEISMTREPHAPGRPTL